MTVPGINKREFKSRLVKRCGGCVVQHTGWPCGTCFYTITDNQVLWHSVLVYRGDSEDCKVKGGYRMANGIVFKDNGDFSHHTYTFVPKATIEQNIRALWEVIK